MASYSRTKLVEEFQEELYAYNLVRKPLASMAKDTTHIQMASVDEMMSAFGYVPRRLPNYPDVKDGRFGYVLAFPGKRGDRRYTFMSFESAVRLHNNSLGFFSRNRASDLYKSIAFARSNRIVEKVALQRTNGGGLISQKQWIKFRDREQTNEYFGIPFDDGLVHKEDE